MRLDPFVMQAITKRFNQENVHIVNCRETPIKTFTEKGIELENGQVVELDVIICASGFNAVDGSYNRVKFHGLDNKTLADKWKVSPSALYGLCPSGFRVFLLCQQIVAE